MKEFISIFCFMFFTCYVIFAQEETAQKTTLSSTGGDAKFQVDSIVKHEDSPMDIDRNRGLFIVTPDEKMQLRILGSVRYLVSYDMVDMPIKKVMNTYFIPTGEDNVKLPNYYNSLNQSRFGFEVTRRLDKRNVFVRLEMDFNGGNGDFRMRHAYGQIDRFLVGRTWSLFSNVSSMPAMVNGDGPTGSVTLRTPQIRYTGKGPKGTKWAVALEYSQPDINISDYDTLGISTVQVIPDLTARWVWEGMLGVVQLSGVINTISKKDENNKVSSSFGIGGSLSGTVELPKEQKILYQFTYGRSISHFITTFSGTGNDAIFNPLTNNFESQNAFGGFLAFSIVPKEKFKANIAVGYAQLYNRNSRPPDDFKNSMSISADSFWNLTEGARIGLEYMYGQRWDISGETGRASRVWALFYYDF